MAEENCSELNITDTGLMSAKDDDNIEDLKKKNESMKALLGKVFDLLKEKTNVTTSLEKQNSALTLQISSLKEIVAITKNLLSIRNSEVENMQQDMTSLQIKINEEKERHNKMISSISTANKLNENIKDEYQNQMKLFRQLRDKYNERIKLLTNENQKLKDEVASLKVAVENEKNKS